MGSRSIATGALALVLAALVSPALGSTAAQLPNLVALAPFDVEIGPADDSEGDTAIRFATGAANRGDHPLELTGQPTGPDEAIAQQCVAWLQPRVCAERKEVGMFGWHPDHGHFHFEDFAEYELRRLRRNGKADMRKRGLVATSGKISYCIIDYEADASERPLLYSQPYPLYYSCLAGIGVQGISPGWKDIYVEETPGQQIPLTGIPDGTYALVVRFDPANRLLETHETDNLALTRITLSGRGTSLNVLCSQEPGQTECTPSATPE